MNVKEYFKSQLGHDPDDYADGSTLADLPLDSPCGQDCKKAIDAAKAYLDLADSHPSVVEPLIESVNAAVACFWVG
jgi:hypothetical protein